ncbi:MAG: tetratricopeptide repeat protein [Gemmatimonadaceae bacterium]|jgi:serine/threonine-protein kinase|nr:tetratricopeptide repeat protein [Gemmatimonadaceae bacterium]
MADARWHLIERLFHEALMQSETARDGWLDAHCDDAGIRVEVRRLLAADAQLAQAPLLEAAVQAAARDVAASEVTSSNDARVGPWRLLHELGRGGMGIVWLAERADGAYDARVAIKLLRSTLASEELMRRFRTERQILADLDHPNIARLVDGGTALDGTPYLAMEYVPGTTITAWAEAQGLGLEARLQLFLRVCDAVAYAHRALVVHRDLKPSNILVTPDGVPKLVDFGIAKLLDATSADDTTDLRPMTPAYASPEQVRGERLTVATDVFSLGVVLYELLTGTQPFRKAGDDASSARQRILTTEPPLPSRLVSGGAHAPGRHVDAARLVGDLDTIVQTALRKDSVERYASVERLADDLRRHLDGRPLLARPATPWYVLQKFVGRHRATVIASVTGVALLVGATTFYTKSLQRARDVAEAERVTAEQTTAFLTDMFRRADPTRARGETITVRAALDEARVRLATDLTSQPAVRARLLQAMGVTYRNLALFATADTVLRDALSLYARLEGTAGGVGTASVLEQLAQVQVARTAAEGRVEEGRAFATRALAIRERIGDPLPLAGALRQLAAFQLQTSLDSARAAYTRALALQQRALTAEHREVLTTRYSLAMVALRQGRVQEAIDALREVHVTRARVLPRDDPQRGESANLLAGAWAQLGQHDSARVYYEEALALVQRVFGPEHVETADGLHNLATAVQAMGDRDSSIALLERALAIRRATYGALSGPVANTLMTIGNAHNIARAYRESLPWYREAITVYDAVLPSGHRSAYYPRFNLGIALNSLGRLAEAETVLREALRVAETSGGADAHTAPMTQHMLGEVLRGQGRTREAIAMYKTALDRLVAVVGPESFRVGHPAEALASLAAERGDHAEVVRLYRAYWPAVVARFPDDAAGLGTARSRFASALQVTGESAAADSVRMADPSIPSPR